MYILTKGDGIESGAFASIDTDGETIIQFFVEKDDAITYNTMLELSDKTYRLQKQIPKQLTKCVALLAMRIRS